MHTNNTTQSPFPTQNSTPFLDLLNFQQPADLALPLFAIATLLPNPTSLCEALLTQAAAKAKDLGEQAIQGFGCFFSHFSSDSAGSSTSCAVSALALNSGQPLLQIAGTGLLFADCLPLKGVKASATIPTFVSQIKSSGNYTPWGLKSTQDGGYVVAGQVTTALSSGNSDIFITKFTNKGEQLWTTILNGSAFDSGYSLQEMDDGGYVVSGHTHRGGRVSVSQSRFYPNGTSNDTKVLGDPLYHLGASGSAKLSNNDLILTGLYNDPITGRFGVLLMKTSADGSPIWTKKFEGTNDDVGRAITNTSDGGYAVTGYTKSTGAQEWALLVEKFTSDGTLSWARALGRFGTDVGATIEETQDGSLVIGGHTNSVNNQTTSGLLTKFSSSGDVAYAMAFGGDGREAFANDLQITQNGEVLVTGSISGFDAGTGYIAKFNALGAPVWAQLIKGDSSGFCIEKTPDGGFILCGPKTNPINKESGMFLTKIDENGRVPNCDALEFIDLNATNVTSLLNVSPLFPTPSSISPTEETWSPPSVAPSTEQTLSCPRNSTTKTHSRVASASKSDPFSSSNTHPLSKSQTETASGSVTPTFSLSFPTASHSMTLKKTESESLQQTMTLPRTQTNPLYLTQSTLIEQSTLPLAGVSSIQLSHSGTLLLGQTGSKFQLVTIDASNRMSKASEFLSAGSPQGVTFSRDEKSLFLADNLGNIQVIDISNPRNPTSLGSYKTSDSVHTLMISGSGEELFAGTDKGIHVFSIKTPSDPKTITEMTSYPTSSPVTTIQTNPNNNLVALGSGKELLLLDFAEKKWTKRGQLSFNSTVQSIDPIDQVDSTQLTLNLDNYQSAFVNITTATDATITSLLPGSLNQHIARSGNTLLVSGEKGIQIKKNEQDNWDATRDAGYNPITDRVRDILFQANGDFCVYSDSEGLKLIKIVNNPGRLDVPLPRLQDTVLLGFPAQHVLLNEQNNWIAVGGTRLEFLSNKNLQRPTILGNFTPTGTISEMVFFPDKANLLLADSGGVACVSCFKPEAPRLQSRWETTAPIRSLTLAGSHAYACQSDGITVLDVRDTSNIAKSGLIQTEGASQAIRFSRDGKRAFTADSSGIDIWSVESPLSFKGLSRLDATGFVSNIELSSDEKTLYFSSGQFLGKVNVTDSQNPKLTARIEAAHPIKDIALSNQGKALYVGVEIDGTYVINTDNLQISGNLPSTQVQAITLDNSESRIFVSDGTGGIKIAELMKELPIVPLTGRDRFPVGIQVEETLSFFDQTLTPVEIDQINRIHYLDQGIKRELPLWISADIEKKKIFINAPKELTNKQIQLLISFDLNGVRQETIYKAGIVSSLEVDTQKGSLSINTPSPIANVGVNLTGGTFIPQATGSLVASSVGGELQLSGSVASVNQYLEQVRINPNPLSRPPSEVALNLATVRATDIVNSFPSNGAIRLRSFRFNQPPVVINPMNQTRDKALKSFEIKVPSDTFSDSDDSPLTLSARLENGTKLPSWLKFDPDSAVFTGEAPASMLNQTLLIQLTASDGYLSVNNTWELHIDANHGPFVAKPISPLTRSTGNEFSFAIPPDTFQDLDNNTLTFSAVEEGLPSLPSFLAFEPTTLTFRGSPSPKDIRTYPIKLKATDTFGASAEIVFNLDITFSKTDFFWYVFDRLGVASLVIAPFTTAFFYRSFLYNMIRRKNYWRDTIPPDLLSGKAYTPKNRITGEEFDKNDIAKIQVQSLDKEKWAHDCIEKNLPLSIYVHLYTHPLINEDPLPSWLELNQETGALLLKPEFFPTDNKTYVFQVMGKNGRILESFFINPSQITMYHQASTSPSPTEPQQASHQPLNVTSPSAISWEEVMRELEESEESGTHSQEQQGSSKTSHNDIWEGLEKMFIDNNPSSKSESNREAPAQEPYTAVAISLDDDEANQTLIPSSEETEKGNPPNQPTDSASWEPPLRTRELKETFDGGKRPFSSIKL